MDVIEALPLANTPDVFGLHPNAEIGYYTTAAKGMFSYLMGSVAGKKPSWYTMFE